MLLFKRLTRKLPLALVIMLLLSILLPAAAGANGSGGVTPVNYLALGDSLAAGVINDGTLGAGYPDYIAGRIGAAGYLDSFEKRYAFPGYKTADVLADIRNDVRKDFPGSPDPAGIQENIRKAEIITLSAGANDLLPTLREMAGQVAAGNNVDAYYGIIQGIIGQIGVNTGAILSEIKVLNPGARVYLMGYYNAFPYLPEALQVQLMPVLDNLNLVLQKAADWTGAVYVPTAKVMSLNRELYLPNPANIHPSPAGYQAIAGEFWQAILVDFPAFVPAELLNRISSADLGTGEAIDAAIAGLVEVRDLIRLLPDGGDKTALGARADEAEGLIFNAIEVFLDQKDQGKPSHISPVQLIFLVQYAISEVGPAGEEDTGKVMGYLMPLVRGHATGEEVEELIVKLL